MPRRIRFALVMTSILAGSALAGTTLVGSEVALDRCNSGAECSGTTACDPDPGTGCSCDQGGGNGDGRCSTGEQQY